MTGPLVLSLFPGIGLLDMAFEEVGCCVVRGPDLLWGGDMRNFHVRAGKFDGIIGGPPCQVHSSASGIRGTAKVDLIPEFVRVVDEGRPSWVVMENVPQTLGHEAIPREWNPIDHNVEGRPQGKPRELGRKGNATDASQDRSGAGARIGRGAGWRNDPNTTPLTRNKRSVWTIASQPFAEAHFATFPPALVEPCILAGTTLGGVVLDPFGGAGTTGLVADRLGRDALLIELNPKYALMAERRIRDDNPLFAEVAREA